MLTSADLNERIFFILCSPYCCIFVVKDKLLGGTASSGLGDAILGEVLLMCVVEPQSPAERLWRINWDVLIFLF